MGNMEHLHLSKGRKYSGRHQISLWFIS